MVAASSTLHAAAQILCPQVINVLIGVTRTISRTRRVPAPRTPPASKNRPATRTAHAALGGKREDRPGRDRRNSSAAIRWHRPHSSNAREYPTSKRPLLGVRQNARP